MPIATTPKPFPSIAIALPQSGYELHQEDAFKINDTFPVYAVADGVTLPAIDYPDVGPRRVAEIFCETAVATLATQYPVITKTTFEDAYRAATTEVKKYVLDRGKEYAAVAVLVAVVEHKVIGSRLTDCGWALLRHGRVVFKTPEFWQWQKSSGRSGYGVINGSMDPAPFIDCHTTSYQPGDWLVLFSDGFENHFSNQHFLHTFRATDLATLKQELLAIDHKLSTTNEQFDHERTMIVAHLTL